MKMKKAQKVVLDQLQVQRFVTDVEEQKAQTAKGGAIPQPYWYTACWWCYY